MRSHIGNPKAMAPVNFRRGRGDFHSVAKQASFNIAWRSDFGGFKKDFGRFWEAKTEAKIDFQVVVFRCFFRVHFGINFGFFFGESNHEKSLKTIGFSMVFINFQKIVICEKISKKPRFWNRFRKPKP